MKNLKLHLLLIFLFSQILSGCSSELEHFKKIGSSATDINWQLSPNKPSEVEIKDVQLSYIVPTNLANYDSAEKAINFEGCNCRNINSSPKEERLLIRRTSPKHLEIERRTDNGAAGSGRIFDVDIKKTKVTNGTLVSFNVTKERTYQDGLILPFAIPSFDIRKHLTSGKISYSMDVNSIYNPESVQSNFYRAFQYNNNYYYIETKSASAKADVQFHHYRNGTKVTVKAIIQDLKFEKDMVDINKVIKDLKQKISDVIAE